MDILHRAATLVGELLRPLRSGDEKLAGTKLGQCPRAIRIESVSFANGAPIPSQFAGSEGRSPEVRWSGVPPATRELALLCEDPDAPTPEPFVHWLVYGMPPSVTELPEGQPPSEHPLASGATQGRNSTLNYGYIGPAPPPGHGAHHYHFQLFALDRRLDVEAPVGRDALLRAMKGHLLAIGDLVGTYQR